MSWVGTCSKCYNNPRLSSKFIAKKLVNKVRHHPNIKLSAIQEKVQKKCVVHIPQSKAYRTKAKVMDILMDSHIMVRYFDI